MGALIEIKELHLHVNLQEISKDAKQILKTVHQILTIMPTKAEFQAALDEMGTSIDNIAGDIQRLTEKLQNGGLSATEENDIFSQLQAKAAQLKGVADQTPEDETPGEGGEGETPTEPQP